MIENISLMSFDGNIFFFLGGGGGGDTPFSLGFFIMKVFNPIIIEFAISILHIKVQILYTLGHFV